MQEGVLSRIRTSLVAKRRVLQGWSESASPQARSRVLGPGGHPRFERHLATIDAALAKADDQTLGVCTVCDEPVETRLIEMDYTSSVCLEHLTEAEQRSLESELEMAAAVQRSLLPQTPPESPFLDIAAFSRPAQIVGGDYFDFFPFAGDRHGVAISDVAGHGMSSSLIMASLQTMLRTLTQDHSSPADLVARINRLCIHNIQFTTFVSLFLGAYDPASHRLTYCNAGHNPPLLLRRDGAAGARNAEGNFVGRADWLDTSGAAVGLTEDSVYADAVVSLTPGNVLLLYTDGVTEMANARGELFGAPRLAEAVARNSSLSAQGIVQALRRELDGFSGGLAPADDLTMVAIRVIA